MDLVAKYENCVKAVMYDNESCFVVNLRICNQTSYKVPVLELYHERSWLRDIS